MVYYTRETQFFSNPTQVKPYQAGGLKKTT